MASPRRARSLFLSPEKAELLAAREVNNLVHRVEVVPRKAGPRQGRRTDVMVKTDSGDENRASKASTINVVDHFCEEYRPPSVALHRMSWMDKELPPLPLSNSSAENLYQRNSLSHASTQKDAACQTVVSIRSRYSIRTKPSTASRLSIISSQERDAEDRISIRSRYSTQDPDPIDNTVSRLGPHASVPIDRRPLSSVGERNGELSKRRRSGSISPTTIPHHEMASDVVDPAIEVLSPQAMQTDRWALQAITQDPLVGMKNMETVHRSMSKRRASVGWTFNDGLILRADDRLRRTTGTPAGDVNLDSGAKSKRMIPISWTFRDGIIFRADQSLKTDDGTSKAKSTRMVPIGWSFYDGLILRPDGSVEATSKATGKREEIVPRSKSKRLIPIGWTFHEGLIFTTDDSVHNALTSSDKSKDIETEARSQRLPIAWTFHDGLTLGTGAKAKDVLAKVPNETDVTTRSGSKRTVGWTFNDGLVIRDGANSSPNSARTATWTKSKGRVTWTFNDGLTIKAHVMASSNKRELAAGTRSRRTVGWSFHNGLVIRTHDGVAKRSRKKRGMSTSTEPKGMPVSWSFYNGLAIKQRSGSRGKGKGVDRNLHPLIPKSKLPRKRITYSFWDGVTFRTFDGASSRVVTQPKTKLGWTFYDGISRTTTGPPGQISNQTKPKHTYAWTFHEGLTFKPNTGTENIPKASLPIRGTEPVASANLPTPQPTKKGILDLPNKREANLSPNKLSEDALSDVANEPVLSEEQLDLSSTSKVFPSSISPREPDLSPKSKPLHPSSSISEGSNSLAQPGPSDAEFASLQDRQRRPPASRANTRVETVPSASETRYLTIEHWKTVSKDTSSPRALPNANGAATPLEPQSPIRRKKLRSIPSLENWDGTVTHSKPELATRRKQPSITELPVQNGNGTTPAQDTQAQRGATSSRFKYHIEKGVVVPTPTDLRPQARVLAARRRDMLAECF